MFSVSQLWSAHMVSVHSTKSSAYQRSRADGPSLTSLKISWKWVVNPYHFPTSTLFSSETPPCKHGYALGQLNTMVCPHHFCFSTVFSPHSAHMDSVRQPNFTLTCSCVLVSNALLCSNRASSHMLFISSTKFFTDHLLRATGCCTGVPDISAQPTCFSLVQLNF